MQTSPGGHDFIVGLETDKEGRWYFASGNQGVCRESPDAIELDVLATGFRNPNGLGLSPDGRFITTSVQEGDWTPATSICQIELGKSRGRSLRRRRPEGRPAAGTRAHVHAAWRGQQRQLASLSSRGDKWASLERRW
jgi:sugar lactone lactonase YvrE